MVSSLLWQCVLQRSNRDSSEKFDKSSYKSRYRGDHRNQQSRPARDRPNQCCKSQYLCLFQSITSNNQCLFLQVVLLGLKFEELSWDYAKPSQENNEDCLPCLFIQFCVIENGRRVSKILQVTKAYLFPPSLLKILSTFRFSPGRLYRWTR